MALKRPKRRQPKYKKRRGSGSRERYLDRIEWELKNPGVQYEQDLIQAIYRQVRHLWSELNWRDTLDAFHVGWVAHLVPHVRVHDTRTSRYVILDVRHKLGWFRLELYISTKGHPLWSRSLKYKVLASGKNKSL